MREGLCDEAIRLGRVLFDLLPEEPEVGGLLALMLFGHARRAARVAADGGVVRLRDQDRSLWDRALMSEAQNVLRACFARRQVGQYQLQAAIQAVHSVAPSVLATDWKQIVQLYDGLLALAPTPVVALNRAVALAEVQGPAAALALVEALDLETYHVFHAVRAELLLRLGRNAEAADAFAAAKARTYNAAEQAFFEAQRRAAGGGRSGLQAKNQPGSR